MLVLPGTKSKFIKIILSFSLLLLTLLLFWFFFTPRPPLLNGVSFSTAIYDRYGTLMRLSLAADEKFRIYTPLDEISTELREATLLYEDQYFYKHIGINPLALLRAFHSSYLGGGRKMGASTISMQLARLRLGLNTTTIGGKLKQIERALAYERYYTKDEIFEAYLNLAPYGGNIEGCGAAALIYFQKKVSRLNLIESLSLTSVPQNPTRRNPLAVFNLEKSGSSDRALEDARARLFGIWAEKHPEDAGTALFKRSSLQVFSTKNLPFSAPHVSAEAVALFAGAKEIQSTIDLRLQEQIERMLKLMVARNTTLGVRNGSALLVHWPTMEVRALVGSADFFDIEIEGQVDGTKARRSPGSTLKTFIYALALEQGVIHPHSLLFDTPRSFSGYDPENADSLFKGPVSARDALLFSRNIPAISLATQVSKPNLYEFLKSAGVQFDYPEEHYGLSLVLGGAEVSMRELASLYAMLPNRGLWQPLILFKNTDEQGIGYAEKQENEQNIRQNIRQNAEEEIKEAPEAKQLLTSEAAILALDMIKSIPTIQQTRYAAMVMRIPMYWKTGTSNGYRDAWTAGVFGPYVLVVWVGNFDNTPNPSFIGAKVAAPLFWDIADAIYSIESLRDMNAANFENLNLKKVKVCSATGDLDISLCPDVTETWFIPGVSPIASSNVYREILIDIDTGLRACVDNPGKTRKEVWEFWPTDMQQVFKSAGVIKAIPPRFLPECDAEDYSTGLAPEILSPKASVNYFVSVTQPESSVIVLRAAGDADVSEFFWFANDVLLGKTAATEEFLWYPTGGKTVIRVVDNFGRSSKRMVNILLTE